MGKYAATALFSAVVTAVLVSAFWIWFYNFVSRAPSEPLIEPAGNVVTVKPPQAPPVAIAQAVEELGLQGQDTKELRQLVRETAELVAAAKPCRCSDELTLAVQALELRQIDAEALLRQSINPVQTDPMGLEKEPHTTSTTINDYDNNHTVITSEKSSRTERAGPSEPLPSKRQESPLPYYRVTTAQLLELAPRLGRYVPPHSRDFSFDTIVEAAFWLAGEMGISSSLWARACQLMGRETAAVALATVSTRPTGHFTSGPGGYFAGMLRKYEKGELHLERSLWRLKDQIWGTNRQHRTKQ